MTQKYRITVPKDFVDFVYTIPLLFIQNYFLTCFDLKISHLGSNDYSRLILDPKWNFGLDLKHNVVLAFWETKSTYFCSKMLYCPHFGPKKIIWTQKGLYLDQNIVLKCFDTEILYYGSKGFWGLCLYDSSTLSLNFFLTCFDIKISHFGSNEYSWLVLNPKWIFCWLGFYH